MLVNWPLAKQTNNDQQCLSISMYKCGYHGHFQATTLVTAHGAGKRGAPLSLAHCVCQLYKQLLSFSPRCFYVFQPIIHFSLSSLILQITLQDLLFAWLVSSTAGSPAQSAESLSPSGYAHCLSLVPFYITSFQPPATCNPALPSCSKARGCLLNSHFSIRKAAHFLPTCRIDSRQGLSFTHNEGFLCSEEYFHLFV